MTRSFLSQKRKREIGRATKEKRKSRVKREKKVVSQKERKEKKRIIIGKITIYRYERIEKESKVDR